MQSQSATIQDEVLQVLLLYVQWQQTDAQSARAGVARITLAELVAQLAPFL